MIHVFTVHSSLTFLIAYSVIKHLKLYKEEVILITSGYIVPIDGFNVFNSFEDDNKSWSEKILKFNVPNYYDKYIDKLTYSKPFIAYIDLMSYYQKILVTNKNCQGFHFIEEGNSAYQSNDDLTDISWHERSMNYRNNQFSFKSLVRVLRGYNLRLLSLPYIYSAYVNMENIRFFSFSKNAFYNAPYEKKILVSPDLKDENIALMSGNFQLENQVVWLDGSNARYTELSEEYYYNAIQKAIDILKNRNVILSKVYVKLRPGIKDYNQNQLVKILIRNNIEVEVLPDEMILECFFMLSKNCHVIGTLTAALEYAYVFGHKAYSIYGLFAKQPPTFFDRMTGFWENIENLKEN